MGVVHLPLRSMARYSGRCLTSPFRVPWPQAPLGKVQRRRRAATAGRQSPGAAGGADAAAGAGIAAGEAEDAGGLQVSQGCSDVPQSKEEVISAVYFVSRTFIYKPIPICVPTPDSCRQC